MLINYSFKNFKSYADKTTIDFKVSKIKQYLETNSFEVPASLCEKNLLKSLLIIGTNASGKTNSIRALQYMRHLILHSVHASKDNENIFEKPEKFLLDESYKNVPLEFSISFITQSPNPTQYDYYFSFFNEKIIKEVLYKRNFKQSNRKSSTICLIDRTNNTFDKISLEFNNLQNIFEITDSTLLLSYCNENIKEDICKDGKDIINWFKHIYFAGTDNNSLDIYDDHPEYLKIATSLLQLNDPVLQDICFEKRKLDIGICDYKNPQAVLKALNETNSNITGGGLRLSDDGLFSFDIKTKYMRISNNGNQSTTDWSIFDDKSSVSNGTKKLIIYLAPIIKVLKEGGIILVDEVDTALHYNYSKLIIDLFNNNEINKNKGQAIFTSHNIKLLDERLRNDQIILTNKNKYGKSSLVKLNENDKNIKPNHSKSDRYLKGLYSSSNFNFNTEIIEKMFR